MTDCLFCQIVNGDIPATIIYQDDNIIAFDDIYPKAAIHKLIIPKKHIATVNDIELQDQQLIGQMYTVAAQLAKQLGIAEAGYRLIMNCNAHGGQEIYHIHLHLLGGQPLSWQPA